MHAKSHVKEEKNKPEKSRVRMRIHSRRKGEVLVIIEDPKSGLLDVEWLDNEEVDEVQNKIQKKC